MSFSSKKRESFQKAHRNSLGNESILTISSSVADEIVQQNIKNESNLKEIEERLKQHQKVRIDSSKSIQVGEVIYNFYTPPPDGQQSEINISEFQWKNHSNIDFPGFKFSDCYQQTNKSIPRNRCNRISRKHFIILIVAAVFISVSIGVTFFVLYDSDSNKHSNESTFTTEINQNTEITTEIVDTTIFTSSESTTTESSTESSSEAPVMLFDGVQLFERHHWDANPPSDDIKELKPPIKRIIIAHTATDNCEFEEDCKASVKSIQVKNQDLKDIPYNFLIGGDGNVYTGRGFNFEGEHSAIINTTSFNNIGICIGFIGNFSSSELLKPQIEAFESFLKYFVVEGTIEKNYKLFLQDQLVKVKVPADALYETAKNWKNFHEVSKIYRRDEWEAYERCRPSDELNHPVNHLIFDHTISTACFNFESCSDRMKSQQYMAQLSCRNNDIYYNFMFGTNGMVFEGRGFDVVGEHLRAYDSRSLGIGFIGDFNKDHPMEEMISALFKFFNDSVALGKISDSFKVHAIADLSTNPTNSGPGRLLRDVMEKWEFYSKHWE